MKSLEHYARKKDDLAKAGDFVKTLKNANYDLEFYNGRPRFKNSQGVHITCEDAFAIAFKNAVFENFEKLANLALIELHKDMLQTSQSAKREAKLLLKSIEDLEGEL